MMTFEEFPAKARHGKISLVLNRLLEDIIRELHGRGLTHAGQREDDYLEGAPAFAIEVISKANTAEMMQRKVKLYLENGSPRP